MQDPDENLKEMSRRAAEALEAAQERDRERMVQEQAAREEAQKRKEAESRALANKEAERRTRLARIVGRSVRPRFQVPVYRRRVK